MKSSDHPARRHVLVCEVCAETFKAWNRRQHYCSYACRNVAYRGRQQRPLLDRFFSKVEIAPSGCWEWRGATREHGYGWFNVGRRPSLAHRVAYELLVGPIPDGLTLDHLCRNTACVNPSHLEAVTLKENVRRGESPPAQNARKTHCPHGHEYTSENTKVCANGSRKCWTCERLRNRERAARRKAERAAQRAAA